LHPQVPLVTLVGASNELPESEELDALYDRFLLRKEVKQVTVAGAVKGLNAVYGCASVLLHMG
jgi:MoxR-like ATPase